MAANVSYKASAAGDLRKLDGQAARRVAAKIEKALASEGRAGEALTGEFAGLWKLRVGDYRVIYAKTNDGYLVLRIAHRREAFRKGRPR